MNIISYIHLDFCKPSSNDILETHFILLLSLDISAVISPIKLSLSSSYCKFNFFIEIFSIFFCGINLKGKINPYISVGVNVYNKKFRHQFYDIQSPTFE